MNNLLSCFFSSFFITTSSVLIALTDVLVFLILCDKGFRAFSLNIFTFIHLLQWQSLKGHWWPLTYASLKCFLQTAHFLTVADFLLVFISFASKIKSSCWNLFSPFDDVIGHRSSKNLTLTHLRIFLQLWYFTFCSLREQVKTETSRKKTLLLWQNEKKM